MFLVPGEEGASLTRAQVAMSWALAECMSPRWRDVMLPPIDPGLRAKVEAGECRDYSEEEQAALVACLRTRREYFFNEFIDKSAYYRLIRVPVELAQMLPVLPGFGWKDYPVPLGQYMDWDHNPEWRQDPRPKAKAWLENPVVTPFTGHPIIAYSPQLKFDILIEGYVRCLCALMRWRAGEDVPPLMMIYCGRHGDRR